MIDQKLLRESIEYGTIIELSDKPGGAIVRSNTEGMVISIKGLDDARPSNASLYAVSISSMLHNDHRWHEKRT